MVDLSIIIVSYRGWGRLSKCLESLSTFSGKDLITEIIVVDNSLDDRINEIAERFPGFIFIRNAVNGGYANGCNLGSRMAKGEFLLILNPDTVATEAAVLQLAGTAGNNPDLTLLSCRQVNEKGRESIASGEFPRFWNITGFQRALFRRRKPRAGISSDNAGGDIVFPDWISGSVIMIRKNEFEKICGFDEDFWMYFEDVDLCRRVNDKGGKTGFCRNIVIEHNHGGSSRIDLKTTSLTKTEVIISRHLYFSKHHHGIEGVAIQVFLIINNLVSGGITALAGLIFCFIPKLFVRTLIFVRLVTYYGQALYWRSWLSSRSVNFRGKKQGNTDS
jgi:GT2 family glycosyltransferase